MIICTHRFLYFPGFSELFVLMDFCTSMVPRNNLYLWCIGFYSFTSFFVNLILLKYSFASGFRIIRWNLYCNSVLSIVFSVSLINQCRSRQVWGMVPVGCTSFVLNKGSFLNVQRAKIKISQRSESFHEEGFFRICSSSQCCWINLVTWRNNIKVILSVSGFYSCLTGSKNLAKLCLIKWLGFFTACSLPQQSVGDCKLQIYLVTYQNRLAGLHTSLKIRGEANLCLGVFWKQLAQRSYNTKNWKLLEVCLKCLFVDDWSKHFVFKVKK